MDQITSLFYLLGTESKLKYRRYLFYMVNIIITSEAITYLVFQLAHTIANPMMKELISKFPLKCCFYTIYCF